jgi:anaerobic selenocysteine-containing dehydrogenase/Fe-S-cluster-containing dehydrogenase component
MIPRRHFLKLIGASGTAAALERCAPAPTERLVPYLVGPDDLTPGVAAYYATTCRECPAGCGLLAKTREGRLVKLEGNPRHPLNRGALCVRGQAAVQGLYDPDRFRGPLVRRPDGRLEPIPWEHAERRLAERLAETRRSGRRERIAWVGRLLTGSLERLTRTWLAALGSTRRLMFETFDHAPLRRASEIAVGRREIPLYRFDEARAVVSFGADFLETWISNVEFTAAFARRRRRWDAEEAPFTFIGPRLSLTGLNADEWFPAPPGSEAAIALALVHTLVEEQLAHPDVAAELGWIRAMVAAYAPEAVASAVGMPAETLRRLARRLAARAPSLVVGGGASAADDQALSLELAVLLLNAVAGNLNRTVCYGVPSALDAAATYDELLQLAEAMSRGDIDVLFLHHANPVLTLPARSGFAEALRRVPLVVSFALVPDESTEFAHLVLPDHHFLESWDDYAPRAGVHALQQPAMTPLFDTRATGDVLLDLARQIDERLGAGFEATDYREWLQRYWNAAVRQETGPERPWDLFWQEALQAGGVFTSPEPVKVRLRPWSADVHRLPAPTSARGDRSTLALVVYPSAHLFDGRSGNHAWLQEIPDPVTKVVWDGWIEVHPDTARRLGLAEGDLVEVRSPHGRVTTTVRVYRGLHPDVVAMPLGYGRTPALRNAGGGANPATLLAPEPDPRSGTLPWRSARVTLIASGRRAPLVIVQADPPAGAEAPGEAPSPSRADANGEGSRDASGRHVGPRALYPPHDHPEHRWGMVIDLDACTGCNACVAACYAENNVPVVGKTRCAQGREMAWLRIERSTASWSEPTWPIQPETVFLPMLCQHCDQAPCESVCPVYATYHNPEGLNAQIYNRCIGTRYCSNNCPYKVRRFNFFTWSPPDPLPLQLNPDVTVRTMGVMEKCTFCVQRIQSAKLQAKLEGRTLSDGDITPACAQTCPAEAIVFGDLKDPNSRVARLAHDPRGFHLLDALNTRPAITYLRRRIRSNAPIDRPAGVERGESP